MSDTSVSPTPSQENRANTMHDALDSLMSVQEQSYDDFMNGFTYLTKDDINKQLLKKREKFLKKTEDCQGAQLMSKEETSSIENKNVAGSSEELDLEVQTLEAGTTASIMNKQPAAEMTKVKFDNFVETEDDEELESEESGYVASFGEREVKSLEAKDASLGEISKAELPDRLKCENDTLIQESCFDKSRNRDSVGSLTIGRETEGSLINPGEVDDDDEEELSAPVSINDRKLDFAASYRTASPHKNDQDQDVGKDVDQVCSDEVEAFVLDENFDYDNVVLTPKFSADVIEHLRSFSENSRNTNN